MVLEEPEAVLSSAGDICGPEDLPAPHEYIGGKDTAYRAHPSLPPACSFLPLEWSTPPLLPPFPDKHRTAPDPGMISSNLRPPGTSIRAEDKRSFPKEGHAWCTHVGDYCGHPHTTILSIFLCTGKQKS